jgi:hypothetical protein
MKETSQSRAIRNYRGRLSEKGMSRFEVLTLDADRELIRSLAKRLAQNDAESERIRSEITRSVLGGSKKGGIFAALQRSPMAKSEVDLDLQRPYDSGRKIDL